jgi:predicted metal-dependent peptidase
MHMWRRDGRDPAIWNIANDAIINADIKRMGFCLPKGGVSLDWVTPDMDSETVYNRLMQETDEPDDGDGDGSGDSPDDGDNDSNGGSPSSKGKQTKTTKKWGKGGFDKQGDLEDAPNEAAKADMEATIRAAAEMARACGDNSDLVNRTLGAVPKASVNWKDEVRAALTSSARDDFSYRRFSRRFLSRGMYLPALQSDAMGGLLIGFDTSGSMSPRDCEQVAGEIQGIIDDLSPDWVEVVYCDAEIPKGGVQRFQRGDTLELKPVGGGGTRFKPVFDHAAKLEEGGDRVAALIYLTDLEGPLDELVEPDYPVVWGCVYGDADTHVPFGKVVQVIVS